jgi:hypothetical protein
MSKDLQQNKNLRCGNHKISLPTAKKTMHAHYIDYLVNDITWRKC